MLVAHLNGKIQKELNLFELSLKLLSIIGNLIQKIVYPKFDPKKAYV